MHNDWGIGFCICYVKRLMMTYALISANIIIFILAIPFPETTSSLGYRPIYLSLEYFP